MFKGIDMNEILGKAQELQRVMQQKKAEAAKRTVGAQVGGGMVKTVMNGNLELLSIEIDPEVIKKEEKETLEDLIRAAVNENLKKAQELNGGNNLNDLFGNFDLSKLSQMGFPFGGEK